MVLQALTKRSLPRNTPGRHIDRFKLTAVVEVRPAFDPVFSCREPLPYAISWALQHWNTLAAPQLPLHCSSCETVAESHRAAQSAQVKDAMSAASTMPMLTVLWEASKGAV